MADRAGHGNRPGLAGGPSWETQRARAGARVMPYGALTVPGAGYAPNLPAFRPVVTLAMAINSSRPESGQRWSTHSKGKPTMGRRRSASMRAPTWPSWYLIHAD